MDESDLTARLPADIAARTTSLKQRDGNVTLVLDGTGLNAAARAELTSAAEAVLSAAEGVSAVHIAVMADRVRRNGSRVVDSPVVRSKSMRVEAVMRMLPW